MCNPYICLLDHKKVLNIWNGLKAWFWWLSYLNQNIGVYNNNMKQLNVNGKTFVNKDTTNALK